MKLKERIKPKKDAEPHVKAKKRQLQIEIRLGRDFDIDEYESLCKRIHRSMAGQTRLLIKEWILEQSQSNS